MPPKKKETKVEEPVFVDEEGTFIHEAETAKYTGGIRRYMTAAAAAGQDGHAAPAAKAGAKGGAAKKAEEEPADAGGGGGSSLAVLRHGRGTYTSPMLQYDGDWVEDSMEGNGTLLFVQSGSRYTGGFRRGQFEGSGTYVWADGSSYEGLWRGNRMHGTGTYTDVNGCVWTGQYFNGTGPGLEQVYHRASAAASAATSS